MSFSVSALLNPASEPSSPKPQTPQPAQAQEAPTSNATAPVASSAEESAPPALCETADALTGLSHGDPSPRNSIAQGGSSSLPSNNDQFGQAGNYAEARRTSSFSSIAAPVEPAAVDAAPQQHSPSLEQYHHRSKSPEEQRRQSLMSMASNPTILPPIHTLEGIPEGRPSDDQTQRHDSSYGHDASQTVPVPSVSNSLDAMPSPNAAAQSREPDYVREEPTTAQIRAPSPRAPSAETTDPQTSINSPTPQVKLEPTATSREHTPAQAAPKTEQGGGGLDVETLKAVADARNEHGLRGASREASTTTASTAPTMEPAHTSPTAPKKRKPVDSKIRKKGGSGPRPSNKKRKIEGESGRPSPTPSVKAAKTKGSKKSQTGTPVAGSSPAPHSSPPPQTADDDDDDESGSDDGIYCICRKGDNHTWMIACDGSCQDWYHGTCVNVKESDGDLIEKYFCPRCTAAGEGLTTWKRMCRRQGCRRPARRDEQSKYCSDECGVQFFRDMVTNLRGAQAAGASNSQKSKRDRRKANQTDNTQTEGEDTEDDGPSGPRGGVVSARHLKALTLAARDVDHFKNLGNSMLSPPATASPSSPTFKQEDHPPLSGPDAARVATIQTETRELRRRFELLKDRERFVSMTRDQLTRLAEREGVKPKDICGYDSRLAWSEGEFAFWRATPKGKACLRKSTLEAEPEDQDKEDVEMKDGAAATTEKPLVNGDISKVVDGDGDVDMDGAAASSSQNQHGKEGKEGREELFERLLAPPELCPKKRCQRHTQWAKIASYDVQFELSITKHQIAELGAEEREIRERALVSWRKETKAASAGAIAGAGSNEKSGGEEEEGWVEMLS